MHRTSKQIDAGHQGHSAVALVLMVALRGGVGAGNRGEIRSGIADRLNTRLLVIREDGDLAPAITVRGGPPQYRTCSLRPQCPQRRSPTRRPWPARIAAIDSSPSQFTELRRIIRRFSSYVAQSI